MILLVYLLIIAIVSSVIYITLSYSVVSYNGSELRINGQYKEILIDELIDVSTWWCYDFGGSSIDYNGHGTEGKSVAHSNKINCYIKFSSGSKEAYVYEQIYFSTKFPNNHPYLPAENIDKASLVKVWDIDKCLRKLKLDQKRAHYK